MRCSLVTVFLWFSTLVIPLGCKATEHENARSSLKDKQIRSQLNSDTAFDMWYSNQVEQSPNRRYPFVMLFDAHNDSLLLHIRSDHYMNVFIGNRKVFEPKNNYLLTTKTIFRGIKEYFLTIGEGAPRARTYGSFLNSSSRNPLSRDPFFLIPLKKPNLLFEFDLGFGDLLEIDEERDFIVLRKFESEAVDTIQIVWSENPLQTSFDNWYRSHVQRGRVKLREARGAGFLKHLKESLITTYLENLDWKMLSGIDGAGQSVSDSSTHFSTATYDILKGKEVYFLLVRIHPLEEKTNPGLYSIPLGPAILIPLNALNLAFEFRFDTRRLVAIDEERNILLLRDSEQNRIDTLQIAWSEKELETKNVDNWYIEQLLLFPETRYPCVLLAQAQDAGYLNDTEYEFMSSVEYSDHRKEIRPLDGISVTSRRIVKGNREYYLIIGGHPFQPLPYVSSLGPEYSVHIHPLDKVRLIPIDRPNIMFECEFKFRSLVEIDEEKGIILLKRDESETLDTIPIIWSENPHYSKD